MKPIRCILGLHRYRTHKKTRVTYRLGNSYALTMSNLELCARCGHKRSDVITSNFRHTDNTEKASLPSNRIPHAQSPFSAGCDRLGLETPNGGD